MVEKEKLKNDVLVAMTVYIDACMLRVLEAVLIEKLQDVDIVKATNLPTTEMSDNEYIIKLFLATKAPKLSAKTVEQYMYSLRGLVQTVHKSLLHMTDMDIEYFLQEYAKKGNSNVSINNVRRNISAIYTWMRKRHLLTENPVDNTEIRRVIERPVAYLEDYEIEELRSGCHKLRDRALLEFLRSTGVRVGEVPNIKRTDIAWNDGSIVLFAPKTQQYRTVFLDDPAKYHLKKYLDGRNDNNESLFVATKSPFHTIKESGIRSVIKKIAGQTPLKQRVYPHLIRKTFATHLDEKGCPLTTIQDLMGHRSGSVVTKKHYIATDTRRLAQAHRRYR